MWRSAFVHVVLLVLLGPTCMHAQGVQLVEDIWPGGIGSLPGFIGQLHGKVLFHAQTNEDRDEPYISDGTPEGTFQLADLNEQPIIGNSNVRGGYTYNDQFYFFARCRPDNSLQLCRTDGTVEGTGIFLDVPLMPGGHIARGPFVEFNGALYFLHTALNNSVQGAGLWTTDGTAQGTHMVSTDWRIYEGPPASLVVHDDHLWFASFGNPSLHTLYKMDAAGTLEPVFTPQILTSRISRIIPAATGLYFVLDQQLWWTDGTPVGTLQLTDLDGQGVFGFTQSHYTYYAVVGDTLYFCAGDAANGQEPWRSDGTVAGTFQLADIRPGTDHSTPANFFKHGDNVYFTAWGGPGLLDVLCRTDGTPAGTVVLDSLDYLELRGPHNGALYAIGGSPAQVHVLDETTGQLVRVTGATGADPCTWVCDMAWGEAGLFLCASTPDVDEELFLFAEPVGMDQPAELPMLSIYPNPVGQVLQVVVPTNAQGVVTYAVHDILGKRLLQGTLDNAAQIAVGGLANGVYNLTIHGGGQRQAVQFVKE